MEMLLPQASQSCIKTLHSLVHVDPFISIGYSWISWSSVEAHRTQPDRDGYGLAPQIPYDTSYKVEPHSHLLPINHIDKTNRSTLELKLDFQLCLPFPHGLCNLVCHAVCVV